MKSINLITIICLSLVLISIPFYNIQKVDADSGFDSSYDSDFDDFDFSSSDWDSYDWDDSDFEDDDLNIKDNLNSEKDMTPLIIIITILSLGGLAVLTYMGSNKKNIVLDKSFNKDEFIKNTFKIYKDLQTSYMNFDYHTLKSLVSNEMYNMYIDELETLKVNNQKNIIDDIELIKGDLIDYSKALQSEIFKVGLSVRCYDYVINTINNEVVKGVKDKKVELNFILTFGRNIETLKKCPKCGAPVNDLTECEYCKSKIVNSTSNLILVKKEIKHQK